MMMMMMMMMNNADNGKNTIDDIVSPIEVGWMAVLLFVLSHLQIIDAERILKDVGSISTHSNACGGC